MKLPLITKQMVQDMTRKNNLVRVNILSSLFDASPDMYDGQVSVFSILNWYGGDWSLVSRQFRVWITCEILLQNNKTMLHMFNGLTLKRVLQNNKYYTDDRLRKYDPVVEPIIKSLYAGECPQNIPELPELDQTEWTAKSNNLYKAICCLMKYIRDYQIDLYPHVVAFGCSQVEFCNGSYMEDAYDRQINDLKALTK